MDRLTRRLMDGKADCVQCSNEFAEGKYTENGMSYCSGECFIKQAQLDKLAEYEDLEERGLLVKLPCKVGECVYVVEHKIMRFGDKTEYMCNEDCEFYELARDYDKDGDFPYNVRMCQKNISGICPVVVHSVVVEGFETFDGEMYPCYPVYEGNIDIENYYITKEEAEKALAEMEEKQ